MGFHSYKPEQRVRKYAARVGGGGGWRGVGVGGGGVMHILQVIIRLG